jgi:hypothetical protein
MPNLADRYDNPILRTCPPGYMHYAGKIDALESVPGLLKRLQIQALARQAT